MAILCLRRSAFFVSYLLLFIFSYVSAAASKNNVSVVPVTLYYEALCPSSARFIVKELGEIFQNDIIDIINLHLVPYGNAKLGPPDNTSITCQFGETECLLNTVEACAIHAWPKLDKYYTYLRCIESRVVKKNYTWQYCSNITGLPQEPIDECLKSGLGKQLELQYANETNSLNPPHEFLPWVVVDEKPLKQQYLNFTTYICNAYKRYTSDLPLGCQNLPPQTVSQAKENEIKDVSHAGNQTAARWSSWRPQRKMATSAKKVSSKASF